MIESDIILHTVDFFLLSTMAHCTTIGFFN
jgi:hypothetical protein